MDFESPGGSEQMLAGVITKLVGWAVAVFYEIERAGPSVPPGPVLVTANHPNALVDPLVIFHTAGRPTRPLAKAPLFEQAMVGSILRGLGGLPVYRRQDDPALMHLNDRTFDAAIAALQEGGAVQIYPEGKSHSEPALAPLRTGAARIALRAEAERGWTLGLKIQPVGLTYARKHLFRGRALAIYGEPFEVAAFCGHFERDERDAVRALTDEIRDRLAHLTLNFEQAEDEELVDVAERLWARQKKLARPRDRRSMAERVPRLQRFAAGLRWLRQTDPERLERLRRGVRRYLRLLTLFGAGEGDVPARYPPWAVARYMTRQLARLVLVLPVALVGVAAWILPFLLTRHVAPRLRPKLDQVATYKVGMAMVVFPLWYGLLVVGALVLEGPRAATAVALGLPVAGLATVAFRDRQNHVRQDVRVFLRAWRRSEARDRMREQRAWLVAELDAVAEAWRQDQERRVAH